MVLSQLSTFNSQLKRTFLFPFVDHIEPPKQEDCAKKEPWRYWFVDNSPGKEDGGNWIEIHIVGCNNHPNPFQSPVP